MKIAFAGQILEKKSDIKFPQNPFLGTELFHADGQTDMTKLIIAFLNFANALKK
jgi:hypothetical protein